VILQPECYVRWLVIVWTLIAVISNTRIRRGVLSLNRRLREARMVMRALYDTEHPVVAHLIPVRRCNLSCTYCNEYDKVSDPVPTSEMQQRIDRLAALRTSVVTFSGGEPMLHPDLDSLLRHIRSRGMISSLITNGYFLTAQRIQKLNTAGLEYLQISIDNVSPDDISKKSLKVLDAKLQLLAEYAEFHVNINSVVGGGIEHPEDALTIAERSVELGFSSTIGVIHNSYGQLQPLSKQEERIYRKVKNLGRNSYSRLTHFQDNIVAGKANTSWRCRAGARYLYVCEDGLVHYCSQQRGYPGIPLEDYTREHIREAYNAEKPCAPLCTISCVHKVSTADFWRDPQTGTPSQINPNTFVAIQSTSHER
jgi:MoaA/NifB/PqqE/SkfB family radical SAM enzyme